MTFGKFLHILIFILISCSSTAQITFLNEQEKVFATAENQFLCLQLKKNNTSHFKCNDSAQQWTLPSDTCLLFGEHIFVSSETREKFRSLIFPEGDCKRYISLISLCDLYFPLFRKDCQTAQLHDDFKILPLLLSGCNQSHEDRSGKAGLWNLDYLVARKYHLRVDSIIDERKGGDFTTHAAVNYLSELSKKFNGNPLVTIVAYQRGVPLAQQYNSELKGNDFLNSLDENMRSFIQLYAYLSELIASTRMTNQLNNYFDIMAQFEPLPAEREVKYQALTEVLQQDSHALKQFNPVYIGSYIPFAYRKIPFMIDRVSALRFEALSDSIYNWQPRYVADSEAPSISEMILFHKVKRGESLGMIASKYHVSVSQLKKWNRLKGDKISKGQSLKILRNTTTPQKEIKQATAKPIAPPKSDEAAMEDHSAQIKKLEQEAKEFIAKKEYKKAILKYEEALKIANDAGPYQKKISDVRKKMEGAKSNSGKTTYVVKSGDSLWTIAKKYPGVSDKDIMKWNNCSENLKPGQKLIIHTK